MRSEIAYWLTEERFTSWNLAIIVTSELHSAVEALWHGWDANHPLHGHPSAAPARDGLRALYIETDKMLAGFAERFPDARMVVFAMHGMGPNKADVISMALLPELLYRLSKGRPALNSRSDWLATGGFSMRRDEDWSNAVNACLTLPERVEPAGWQKKLRATWNRVFRQPPDDGIPSECLSLSWMPSTRYQAQWPLMNAFAIPSFYDGQIRVNLAGREAAGTVTLADYPDFLGQLENELRKLTDAATGLPVVAATSRPLSANPLAANPTQCDLKITWACNALAINHPEAGKIGPLPYRRTGGHTGKSGFAALLGCGLNKGFAGTRNSMDIMPTIAELAGASAQQLSFSGRSLLGIDDQAS
jgi:predicted AlkP superfamily phosphohydrolase/phosphomutase